MTKLGAGKYFGEIALMEEHTMRTYYRVRADRLPCSIVRPSQGEGGMYAAFKFMREAARRKQQVADLLLERSSLSCRVDDAVADGAESGSGREHAWQSTPQAI